MSATSSDQAPGEGNRRRRRGRGRGGGGGGGRRAYETRGGHKAPRRQKFSVDASDMVRDGVCTSKAPHDPPLNRTWVAWAGPSWRDCPRRIHGIRHISAYAGALLALPGASRLAPGAEVGFFEDGVAPTWEDPTNANGGGKWQLCVARADAPGTTMDAVHVAVLDAVMSERLSGAELIVGVHLTRNKGGWRLSVWCRGGGDAENYHDDICRLGEAVQSEVLRSAGTAGAPMMTYTRHSDAIVSKRTFDATPIAQLPAVCPRKEKK